MSGVKTDFPAVEMIASGPMYIVGSGYARFVLISCGRRNSPRVCMATVPPGAIMEPSMETVSARFSPSLRVSSVPISTLAPASVRMMDPFSIMMLPRASTKSVENLVVSSAPVAASFRETGLRSLSLLSTGPSENLPWFLLKGSLCNCSATGSIIVPSTSRMAGKYVSSSGSSPGIGAGAGVGLA